MQAPLEQCGETEMQRDQHGTAFLQELALL